MPISDRDHVIRVTYTDQIPQMSEEGYRHQVAFGFNEEGGLAATSGVSLTDETI
jgi:hypothetical protein